MSTCALSYSSSSFPCTNPHLIPYTTPHSFVTCLRCTSVRPLSSSRTPLPPLPTVELVSSGTTSGAYTQPHHGRGSSDHLHDSRHGPDTAPAATVAAGAGATVAKKVIFHPQNKNHPTSYDIPFLSFTMSSSLLFHPLNAPPCLTHTASPLFHPYFSHRSTLSAGSTRTTPRRGWSRVCAPPTPRSTRAWSWSWSTRPGTLTLSTPFLTAFLNLFLTQITLFLSAFLVHF